MADDFVLRALHHVWQTLSPLELPMAVMGGLAQAAWKHVRSTRDVDVLVSLGEVTPERLMDTLRAASRGVGFQPASISLPRLAGWKPTPPHLRRYAATFQRFALEGGKAVKQLSRYGVLTATTHIPPETRSSCRRNRE